MKKMRWSVKGARAVTCLLAVALAGVPALVRSATDTWQGPHPGSGLWTNTANWSTGAPPTFADTASIVNGGNAIVDTDQTISQLVLQAKSALTISSGVFSVTGPGNQSKWADSGTTSYVYQTGGALFITNAGVVNWGYGAGNVFYGRFSGGVLTNIGTDVRCGVVNGGADIEVSSNFIWNGPVDLGYTPATRSVSIFRQKDTSSITGAAAYVFNNFTYHMDAGTLTASSLLYVQGFAGGGPAAFIMTGGVVNAGSTTINGPDASLVISNGTANLGTINVQATASFVGGQALLLLANGATTTCASLRSGMIAGACTSNWKVVNNSTLYSTTDAIWGRNSPSIVTLGDNVSSGVVFIAGKWLCELGFPCANDYISGWGTFQVTNGIWIMTNNTTHSFTADGYGTDRTLSVLTPSIIQYAPNHSSGRSGWYAQNHGKLVLSNLAVKAGNSITNWGDGAGYATNTLINSVQFAFTNANAGSLGGALLASNRTDISRSAANGMVNVVGGVWEFDGVTFGGGGFATLNFRYDDLAAVAQGYTDESALKIFQCTGGYWRNVTASVDTNAAGKRIKTIPLTSLGQFAIGTRANFGTVYMVE